VQITTAQVAFSGAHVRYTTAQIVINCTLKQTLNLLVL